MLEMVRYEEKYEQRWDRFVLEHSINGTFLQTRNFLNYHPSNRFKDASLLVMRGSNIVAVIPACDIQDEGKRCFYSHAGSTFGGIVLGEEGYNIRTMEELFPLLESWLRSGGGYAKAVFRQTADIFSARATALLEYSFFQNGYKTASELSFYIDCRKLPGEDITRNWAASRRRGYHRSLEMGLRFQILESEKEIEAFYEILCKNLQKYNTLPVHTLAELLEFKEHRLRENVVFCGAFLGDRIVAGAMLFCFKKQVLHAQYFAQDPDYTHCYAMNFLDYHLIQLAKERGFEKFSFGISTEQHGKVLNVTLAQFKEGFGSDYSVNRSFYKALT